MRRREFLKLAATTSAGAVVFTGCGIGDGDPEREFDIQSPVNNPEDMAFGRDAWYATAQPVSAGGSNLIVRIYEGRAKKGDGDPDSRWFRRCITRTASRPRCGAVAIVDPAIMRRLQTGTTRSASSRRL